VRKLLAAEFECDWLPTTSVAPVLGAHTGAGLVGIAYAAQAKYPALP
jgi:fatty acid-binding protein DegV